MRKVGSLTAFCLLVSLSGVQGAEAPKAEAKPKGSEAAAAPAPAKAPKIAKAPKDAKAATAKKGGKRSFVVPPEVAAEQTAAAAEAMGRMVRRGDILIFAQPGAPQAGAGQAGVGAGAVTVPREAFDALAEAMQVEKEARAAEAEAEAAAEAAEAAEHRVESVGRRAPRLEPLVTRSCRHRSKMGECMDQELTYSVRGVSCTQDCVIRSSLGTCVVANACQFDEASGCFVKTVCSEVSALESCEYWDEVAICG